MEHREDERFIDVGGEQWLAVPVTARLKPMDAAEVVSNSAVKAVANNLLWKEALNPDLVWCQFILDTEGANKNWDYMPRPALMAHYATAKFKPMDMEHTVEEVSSMLYSAKTPRGKNTILGVMTDSALADSDGQILTAKQLAAMEATDDMTRKSSEKLAVVGWACLWTMLFPKTVADIVKTAHEGKLCVSMERWISQWDYLVLDKGTYKSVTRAKAKELGYDTAWTKRQMINSSPILRRSLKFIYGGVACTLNPANPAAIFVSPEIEEDTTSLTKAAASDAALKNLFGIKWQLAKAYPIEPDVTRREQIVAEHLKVTKAIAAYLGVPVSI